jgi:hypothetical protein
METVSSLTNPSPRTPISSVDQLAGRIWDAPPPLRIWHLASLDAPTVAVVWSWAFAWAARIRLPAWAPILLALVAWAAYIADRLLDARAAIQTPNRRQLHDRHFFHWRHRRILLPLAFLAVVASAAIVLTRLPAGGRLPDCAVAAATLAYFSGVHFRFQLPRFMVRFLSPFSSKAFLVGVLFTAGCLLPVWSRAAVGATPISRLLAIPALFFVALAWLNCHAIDKWESTLPDAPLRVGCEAWLLGLGGIILALLLAWIELRPALLIAAGAASVLLLVLLDRFRTRLTPLALRACADLVLLTPALLIIVERTRR